MTDSEMLSLEQLFTEELRAVEEMKQALEVIVQNFEATDPAYTAMRQEIVKLAMTADYLTDRLNDRVPCKWLRNE